MAGHAFTRLGLQNSQAESSSAITHRFDLIIEFLVESRQKRWGGAFENQRPPPQISSSRQPITLVSYEPCFDRRRLVLFSSHTNSCQTCRHATTNSRTSSVRVKRSTSFSLNRAMTASVVCSATRIATTRQKTRPTMFSAPGRYRVWP
jgi:hypothetical protein